MDETAKEEDKADRQRDDAAVHFGCTSHSGLLLIILLM